jgi:hypothetical protein
MADVDSPEIMEVKMKDRHSPSSSLKPGWNRRAVAGRNTSLRFPRKLSSICTNASSSVATTKSLSSNTDFTLPSPTNSHGKPKWNSGTRTRIQEVNEDQAEQVLKDDEVSVEADNDLAPHHQELKKGSILRPRSVANAKPNSELSQSGRSDYTGTSYGSITLGGAASLSSTDTFQNSSVLPLEKSQCNGSILKHNEKEDIQSQTTLQHSNSMSQDGQLPYSIQHYRTRGHLHHTIVEEDDWSSTLSWEDEIHSNHRESAHNSKNDCPSTLNKKAFSTPPKKKIKKTTSPATTKKKKKAPATDSPPKKKPTGKSPTKKTKTKKKQHEMLKTNKPDFSPKSDSVEACDESMHESTEIRYMSSKWTSTNLATDPNKARGHWANEGIDLSSWQSSEDDSSVDKVPTLKKNPQKKAFPVAKKKRFPKRQSNWKSPLLFEEDAEHIPSFPEPPVTTVKGTPRSGYDKNAEWYCGSDDDKNSIISDGSSVLSAFRPNKSTPVTPDIPQSEASMDFGALLGDDVGGSSRPVNVEDSIGIDFLQQNQGQSQVKSMSELMSNLEEGSIHSMTEIELMNEPDERSGVTNLDTSKHPESIPRSLHASETEECSNHGSAPSLTSLGGQDEAVTTGNNGSFFTKLISHWTFRWTMVALALILVLDIVLLSIFLAGRNQDDGDASNRRALLGNLRIQK